LLALLRQIRGDPPGVLVDVADHLLPLVLEVADGDALRVDGVVLLADLPRVDPVEPRDEQRSHRGEPQRGGMLARAEFCHQERIFALDRGGLTGPDAPQVVGQGCRAPMAGSRIPGERLVAEQRAEEARMELAGLTEKMGRIEDERLRAEAERQKHLAAMDRALGEAREEIRKLRAEQRPVAGADGLQGAEKGK
jgi:hypothetical protein